MLAPGLAVDHQQLVVLGRAPVLPGGDVHQHRLEAARPQPIERRLGPGCIEEVRQDHHQPPCAGAGPRSPPAAAARSVRPAGRQLLEHPQDRVNLPPPPQRPQPVGQRAGEGVDRHPVPAAQPDVGQRGRGLAGDVQLGRAPIPIEALESTSR